MTVMRGTTLVMHLFCSQHHRSHTNDDFSKSPTAAPFSCILVPTHAPPILPPKWQHLFLGDPNWSLFVLFVPGCGMKQNKNALRWKLQAFWVFENENHELRIKPKRKQHLKEVPLKINRSNWLPAQMNNDFGWRISLPSLSLSMTFLAISMSLRQHAVWRKPSRVPSSTQRSQLFGRRDGCCVMQALALTSFVMCSWLSWATFFTSSEHWDVKHQLHCQKCGGAWNTWSCDQKHGFVISKMQLNAKHEAKRNC